MGSPWGHLGLVLAFRRVQRGASGDPPEVERVINCGKICVWGFLTYLGDVLRGFRRNLANILDILGHLATIVAHLPLSACFRHAFSLLSVRAQLSFSKLSSLLRTCSLITTLSVPLLSRFRGDSIHQRVGSCLVSHANGPKARRITYHISYT